jgi:D-glycero-D-manno-heptose 1,7-bisphosphate phosphatase
MTASTHSTALRRAVFFDRDGTLNEEVGHMSDLTRFRLLPNAGAAVRAVNESGLLAIVVTNQSGVGRGMMPEELVLAAHDRLTMELAQEQARLDAVFYCPHHPQAEIVRYRSECACRKPSPGMLRQAAEQFGIRLADSFVIGDRYVDIEMAHRAGVSSVLVKTGFGLAEWGLFRDNGVAQPHHVAEDVLEAVRWILGNHTR